MLFTKPIDEIQWDHVIEFCKQRIAEGANLDYKKDFPKNLERTISAFANTLGGLILIGIEEDDENKPQLPIKGIDFKRGLSERVINIILSNITPPVFPEIQVCTNSDKTRAVVVVRIAQSHLTPHSISKSTQVYLRTGNRNKPEELMTIDQIQWLINKRNKSEQLKSQLLSDAESHFHRQCIMDKAKLVSSTIQNGRILLTGCFTMAFCPAYPREPFCTPPDLRESSRKIVVSDYFNGKGFPYAEHERWKIVRAGLVHSFLKDDYVYFSELNTFGLYFYRQKLCQKIKVGNERIDSFISPELFANFDLFCDSALRFYQELGYTGPLQFNMQLDDLSRVGLSPYPGQISGEDLTSLEDKIDYKETINFEMLAEKKDRLIFRWMQEIAWAYGWDIQEKHMLDWYSRHRVKSIKAS